MPTYKNAPFNASDIDSSKSTSVNKNVDSCNDENVDSANVNDTNYSRCQASKKDVSADETWVLLQMCMKRDIKNGFMQ